MKSLTPIRTVSRALTLLSIVAGISVSARSAAACDPSDFAVAFVDAYRSKAVITSKTIEQLGPSLDEARCQQDHAIALLSEVLGPPIGYKIALSSVAARNSIGVDEPLVGYLFSGVMRPNGSVIPVSDGGQLIYEVDLLAVIGDDDIASAQTYLEVAAHLQSIIPFAEVADLFVPEGTKITGPLLTAVNAGARTGVVGAPIPADATPAFVDALQAMQVQLIRDGAVMVEASGTAIMEHPLNSILFLNSYLKERGLSLKKGDVVSLGSFGPFQIAKPGLSIEARYHGLPGGDQTITLSFE